jgi:glutamine synthetase type III
MFAGLTPRAAGRLALSLASNGHRVSPAPEPTSHTPPNILSVFFCVPVTDVRENLRSASGEVANHEPFPTAILLTLLHCGLRRPASRRW